MDTHPPPVVILQSPKYLHNLGAVVRACACFGVRELLWTGDRIDFNVTRLPREFRMGAYKTVKLVNTARPFDYLDSKTTPVCVEYALPGAQLLTNFVHPKKAAYVFGPEDGDVSQVFKRLCHSFVTIPSLHCLNLAAATNIVLYDRLVSKVGEV